MRPSVVHRFNYLPVIGTRSLNACSTLPSSETRFSLLQIGWPNPDPHPSCCNPTRLPAVQFPSLVWCLSKRPLNAPNYGFYFQFHNYGDIKLKSARTILQVAILIFYIVFIKQNRNRLSAIWTIVPELSVIGSLSTLGHNTSF